MATDSTSDVQLHSALSRRDWARFADVLEQRQLVSPFQGCLSAARLRWSKPLGWVLNQSINCFIVCLLGLGDPSDFCRPLEAANLSAKESRALAHGCRPITETSEHSAAQNNLLHRF